MSNWSSNQVLNTGGFYTYAPLADKVDNTARKGAVGTMQGDMAWTLDTDTGLYYMSGDGNDYVPMGNLIPDLSGVQYLWIHAVVFITPSAAIQTVVVQSEDANNYFIFGLNADDRLAVAVDDASVGGKQGIRSAATTTGYHVFDGLINLDSATGLQVFEDGIEGAYNTQDSPVPLAEIGNTGALAIGAAASAFVGGVYKAHVDTYIPSDNEIKNLAFKDLQALGIK